jgi:hypothetical protein
MVIVVARSSIILKVTPKTPKSRKTPLLLMLPKTRQGQKLKRENK